MTFRVGKSRVPQHVETYHPVELQRYVAEVERSGGEPVTRNLEDAFSSAADEDHPKQLRTITSEQQRRVNELLAEWISRHFRPLVIVEDEGFVRVIRYITEDICGIKLSLPERTKIRQEIVRLAVIYRRRVHNAIEIGCLFYSLTSDIWTARNAISYISVTIHYVDDDFRPQSWTLAVRELPGIHESHVIALAIEEILEDWSLPKHNCVMFLRDGGSNMVAAGELLGVKHMACIAHCLHLIVGGAMLKKKKREDSTVEPPWAAAVAAEGCSAVPEREEEVALSQEDRNQIEGFREIAIDDMEAYLDETIAALQRNEMDSVRSVVQRFRSLSVYFRKSAKGSNRLGALQREQLNVKAHEVKKPIVDCATRWNSCWQMLQRMIELEAALVKFFAHLKKPEGQKEFKDVSKKLQRPKSDEWLTIKCLQKLLGPFAIASETLGGQTYPTMPLVLPALSGIRKHLERKDLFVALAAEAGEEPYVAQTTLMMNECRQVMLKLYEKRFNEVEKSELRWVAYLDPRVGKWMSHLSSADTPSASNDLVQAMVELAQTCMPAQAVASRSQTPIQASDEQHRNFMHHHMFGPDVVRREATDLETECKKEFSRYLEAIAIVKNAINPFAWWEVNGRNYPNLRRLARKWLGTVATSVPSERVFSTSGNIFTVKRSSLKPDLVRDLVFLAENSKAMNAQTRDEY
ncbi:hypothetical protein PR003_g28152 [Phytophthora rubi]|uniref:HAT C-terminal dimerisation domain-containing protein n=1 Tax=Phytophthora rubi TaxID=129364 RepID=A0A6A4BUR0_9STRA|nr:hypothetical protein PR003_g28152 [Phytophthora rubi]